LVKVTLRREMSLITGAEMVVIRRRMEAAKRRKVPTWWMTPVLCMIAVVEAVTLSVAGSG
jgi:hypothetical protein